MNKVLQGYFGPEAIRLAYYRVLCWSDRTAKDQVGLKAFGTDLDTNCKTLSSKLIEGKYQPQQGFKFYQPKASKTLRTKTMLKVEDALVYQAIANRIAEGAYPRLQELDDFVFGSVLSPDVVKGTSLLSDTNPHFFFFKNWRGLYQKFKESVLHSIQKDKVQYKFETDITGFFDSIPHYNLLSTLSEKFGVEDEILDLLSNCLNLWSGTRERLTPGVGIPQGVQPSFFFANLLLHELDSLLIGHGFKYYRYMDDISIYGFDEEELLEALLLIDKYTKSHALSINSKKTSIVRIAENEAEAIVQELRKVNVFAMSSESDVDIEAAIAYAERMDDDIAAIIASVEQEDAEIEALIDSLGASDDEIDRLIAQMDAAGELGGGSIDTSDADMEAEHDAANGPEEASSDLNTSDLSGESEQDEAELELDKKALNLSDQDQGEQVAFNKSKLLTLTNEKDIIAFWHEQLQEVQSSLPALFENPEAALESLQLKEGKDDIDFIQYSAQFFSSHRALEELKVHVAPDANLIKYWLFAYRKFFWRANNFGITLGLYRNDAFVKEQLFEMYSGPFQLYEWVRYFLLMTLSLNHEFTDQELRQTYFKLLKTETSDLVKISLYRLLFKHAKSNQFTVSLKKELEKEESLTLKLIIADFNKGQFYGEMDMVEFMQSIGL